MSRCNNGSFLSELRTESKSLIHAGGQAVDCSHPGLEVSAIVEWKGKTGLGDDYVLLSSLHRKKALLFT